MLVAYMYIKISKIGSSKLDPLLSTLVHLWYDGDEDSQEHESEAVVADEVRVRAQVVQVVHVVRQLAQDVRHLVVILC